MASAADAQITLSLDHPTQTVVAPGSGVTTVDFTGTVVLSPGLFMLNATLENPFNSSRTSSLVGTLDPAFAIFATGGFATFTGTLFRIDIATGMPLDLYAFDAFGGTSELKLLGASAGGSIFTPSTSYSVQVIAVPEVSTVWLVVSTVVGAVLWRIGNAGVMRRNRMRRFRP